jgi:hypothetical protein
LNLCYELDFDTCAEGYLGKAESAAGVHPFIAEDFDEELRSPVGHEKQWTFISATRQALLKKMIEERL